jgi:hypothetical protein
MSFLPNSESNRIIGSLPNFAVKHLMVGMDIFCLLLFGLASAQSTLVRVIADRKRLIIRRIWEGKRPITKVPAIASNN